MKIKRILHITAVRELGSGQRNQLIYEVNAAKKIPDTVWHTVAYHSGKPIEIFERSIPKYFDYLILRNLFFWLIVLKYSKKYDLILLRHLAFDPFALIFSPFIKNRVSVHHAKEIDELKLVKTGIQGKLASFIERITGRVAVKNSLIVAGVTEEIAIYENEVRGLNNPIVVYPNGVEVENIEIAEDSRVYNVSNILFMCSYFSEWHGLDILLNSLDEIVIQDNFFIHLVGNLSNQQIQNIEKNRYKDKIIIYGNLTKDEYFKIVSKCDVGLGSLAMFRQNLKEGSTLKVREMLAMGLPVFSGHKDASLPEDFIFYRYSEKFNFNDLLNFCSLHKGTSREEVRMAAKEKIEKTNIIQRFLSQINDQKIRELN